VVGLIERILPPEVATAEAFDDPPDAVLYPGEEELISRAVDKRRREFRTVRHCARQALRQLDVPPAPVLRGERGEPQWPPGVVGSMTHCAGYRAAAVAHNGGLRGLGIRGLGIDAEPHAPLPAGVLDIITVDGEREHLSELAAVVGSTCWDRVLFCAKETVYKAWFPLTHSWLGFTDAAIMINPGTGEPGQGSFSARLLVPGPTITGGTLTQLDGRWLRTDELVITALVVKCSDPCLIIVP
jgi:enterobactin synthetase component D / holo-[acyl-carrier protein] synthase